MTPENKEIIDLRSTIQELIVLVARQGECQKNYIENQSKATDEIKDMLREQKAELKADINSLKEDHTTRLNKHSELITQAGKDISAIKAVNKNTAMFVSSIVSIIVGVIGLVWRKFF